MNKTRMNVIERYLELKRAEKPIKEELEALKTPFYEAMSAYPEGLKVDGALIFRRECAKFDYPAAIIKLESRLKEKKKTWEEKHAPREVVTSWQVKL